MSAEMRTENGEVKFDDVVLNKLASHVYALRDPRDRKIFYIGKAGGNDAQGNERVFSHFSEARDALKNPSIRRSAKVLRILEIWGADWGVEWFIVRYALPDDTTAHHVEAALIDLLEISQNGPSLNIQRGHGVSEHGLLRKEDVEALAVPAVSPSKETGPIFIFPIPRTTADGRDSYDATRTAWRVSKQFRNRKDAIAIGVSNGISKGAFTIDEWTSVGDKWEFTGVPLTNPDLHVRNYLGVLQRAIGFFQYGNYLVVEFNGDGQCRFLRGSSDKEWFVL